MSDAEDNDPDEAPEAGAGDAGPLARLLDLFRGRTPPGPCPYLEGETSSLAFRLMPEADARGYGELLARGWRRQGTSFFRAECPRCTKCRSLRVDVQAFRPTKSQRRCLKRNAHIDLEIRPAGTSRAHAELYNAWHRDMHRRRGWDGDTTTPRQLRRSLVGPGYPFAKEFAYRDGPGGELLGIGLVDEVPGALNSIYFYHHPRWRPLGPGTFSALKELEHAAATGRRWVYLGYWIPENASMAYKNRFAPHQILAGRPEDHEPAVWAAPDAAPDAI